MDSYADSLVLIGSEAVGVGRLLLDDLCLVQWLDCHLFIFNKESNANPPYIYTNKSCRARFFININRE